MVTFHIPDMTCGHCASTIKNAIASVDRTARVEVQISDKRVTVDSAATEAALAAAIGQAGYTAQTLEAPSPARRSAASGCGCGCSSRSTAGLDADQRNRGAAGSCCG
jgi:copper chaperone